MHLVLAYLAGSHVLAKHVERLRTLGVMTAGFHWDDRLYFRGRRVAWPWRLELTAESAGDPDGGNANTA